MSITNKKWLVVKFIPIPFFSLKHSHATSKYGSSHLLPTPYTVKMGVLSAAFCFNDNQYAREIFDIIKGLEIQFRPPSEIIVNKTLIKVFQEEKNKQKRLITPMVQTVVFREFVYFSTDIEIAINISILKDQQVNELAKLLPIVRIFGKNDSFFQFSDYQFLDELNKEFSVNGEKIPNKGMIIWVDDFTEKSLKDNDLFEKVLVYSNKTLTFGPNKDRHLRPKIFPITLKKSGSNFNQYSRI